MQLKGIETIRHKSTQVKVPNDRGLERLRQADGKWRMVVDGVEKRPYNVIANGTFSPNDRHLVYWAKDTGQWKIVVDDREVGQYDSPLVGNEDEEIIAPMWGRWREEGLLYLYDYPLSRFVFRTSSAFHVLAKRDGQIVRVDVEVH